LIIIQTNINISTSASSVRSLSNEYVIVKTAAKRASVINGKIEENEFVGPTMRKLNDILNFTVNLQDFVDLTKTDYGSNFAEELGTVYLYRRKIVTIQELNFIEQKLTPSTGFALLQVGSLWNEIPDPTILQILYLYTILVKENKI